MPRLPRSVPDYTETGDAALVVAVGRYDEDALAEIYRRHAGAMVSLARRLLGSVPRAEEIVQEVFVRLWQTPERFDPDRGALRTFLLSQVHSRSVDTLRSDSSRRDREARDFHLSTSSGYDIEHEIIDLMVAERVRDALHVLDDTERVPILLAYFGGYTYREVAELLDVPEGTLKGRIRSGLRRLRTELGGLTGVTAR